MFFIFQTEAETFDFRKSASCPLDALFMQLTPEWQQLILKVKVIIISIIIIVHSYISNSSKNK